MATKPLPDLYAPLPITEQEAQRLASDYTSTILRALADRVELETCWERAYKLYEGKRPERSFPWKGASNVHIPLVAIHGSAIHARFMTTIFGSEPVWRVRARSPEQQDFATVATDYLEWARQNQFDFYNVVRDFAWDAIKFGLGIIRTGWTRRVGPLLAYEYAKDGTFQIVERDDVVIEDKPLLESVRPDRFIWPQGYDHVQKCPWIAFALRMSPDEVKQAYDDKYFDRGRGIEDLCGVEASHIDQIKADAERIVAPTYETLEIYEVWAKRRLPGKGTQIVQMVIEPRTNTLLRYRLNPYFHGKYPVVIGRLEVREHSITGLGIADQIGDLNESSNTVHNQMIDATTVSICQMFGVRAGSMTEDALTDIHPGKRIPFTNPEDIKEISLGPLKATSLPIEEVNRNYSERRSGISDFGLGREPTPSRRGTATGTLAIIQEGNKKFDYQIRDMREALGELGGMILSMIQQNNPQGIATEILGKDGQSFRPIHLVFPADPIDRIALVEVVAGSPSLNRQSQRQDAISLFQIMMTVYAQAAQLGQQIQMTPSPAMQALYIQIARGAEIMLKELFNAFENRRADEIIPQLEEIYDQIGAETIAQAVAFNAGMAGLPGNSGGAGASSGGNGAIGGGQPPGGGISSPGPNVAGARGGIAGGKAPAG